MFDVHLDLTRYLILWSVFFFVGFIGTFFISLVINKRSKKHDSANYFRSFLLSLLGGIILLVIAMSGIFNEILNILPS